MSRPARRIRPGRARHLLAPPERDCTAAGQHPEVAAGVVQRLVQLGVRLTPASWRRRKGEWRTTASPSSAASSSSASASSVCPGLVQHRARGLLVGGAQLGGRGVQRGGQVVQHLGRQVGRPAQRRARRHGGHQQGQRAADHRVEPAAESLPGSGARAITITDCTPAWMMISCRAPAGWRATWRWRATTMICHTPVPNNAANRSPTSDPTATPMAISTPRRSRWP